MKFFKTRFRLIGAYLKRAFSLVELMVTLIIVSCIVSALAPVITKKLKSNGITVGSGGGGLTYNCAGKFSPDCELCMTDVCLTCKKTCYDDEYKDTIHCRCVKCNALSSDGGYGAQCTRCDGNGCLTCSSGYGVSASGCKACAGGSYSDGSTGCIGCPEGYWCNGKTKHQCGEGTYSAVNSSTCFSCTKYNANCAACDTASCTACKSGFKLKDGNCIIATVIKEYTTAGNHSFTVPAGVTELEVTLVSGGAGGGGGAALTKTDTFVIDGDGNVPSQDSNNVVHKNSSGLFTWTIPPSIKGKEVLVSACGGGGGGSYTLKGGNGGAIKDAAFIMPNWTSIKIHIGGGGGGGADYTSDQRNSGCSLGGGGGSWFGGEYQSPNSNSTSCNAGSGYGFGNHRGAGGAGYDPIYAEHGVGGGVGGTGWNGLNGGAGSRVGGGGGARGYNHGSDWWANGYPCGGGGAATLFYHSEYAKTAKIVAPGGGGASGESGYGHEGHWSCGGGGGGGTGGGAGATFPNAGNNGRDSEKTIFGANYCFGGAAKTRGKNGAMRITYFDTPNGGSGGGSGQIVPKQKITVTPGEVLTITVGQGGLGGAKNARGTGANTNIVSKISRSNGVVLITTAGAKGFITNGRNATQITYTGFSNTNGATTTTKSGGAGGRTTLEGSEIHCSPGGGGASGVAGGDAAGYGGCAGGGGGAGASGGKGSVGYAKIKYGS